MSNYGSVVTLVAVTGAEYVGKLMMETDETIILENPHIVTPDGNNLGFMPTVAMTGEPHVKEGHFNKSGVILVTKTAEAVEKEYLKAKSGIELL
jgi:hypothetical protein